MRVPKVYRLAHARKPQYESSAAARAIKSTLFRVLLQHKGQDIGSIQPPLALLYVPKPIELFTELSAEKI